MRAFFKRDLVEDLDSNLIFSPKWASINGLFETMLVENGRVLDLVEHLQRLENSVLCLGGEVDINEIKADLEYILSNHTIPKVSALRLMYVSGSYYFLFQDFNLLDSYKLKTYDFSGIEYMFGHKHMKYQVYLDSASYARQAGYDAALLYDENQILMEVNHANIIFLNPQGELHCPKSAKSLAGIILGKLKLKMPIVSKEIYLEQLELYSSAFICNSLIGVKSVSLVDQFGFRLEKGLEREMNRVLGR